jgi:hypothetical protein
MQAYREQRGAASLDLDLVAGWKGVVAATQQVKLLKLCINIQCRGWNII